MKNSSKLQLRTSDLKIKRHNRAFIVQIYFIQFIIWEASLTIFPVSSQSSSKSWSFRVFWSGVLKCEVNFKWCVSVALMPPLHWTPPQPHPSLSFPDLLFVRQKSTSQPCNEDPSQVSVCVWGGAKESRMLSKVKQPHIYLVIWLGYCWRYIGSYVLIYNANCISVAFKETLTKVKDHHFILFFLS